MKGFALVLTFFCLTSVLYARGGKEKKQAEENRQKIVQITGVVRMVGSEPFTSIVISGSEYEWYVERGEEAKLGDCQQRHVTVEGIETIEKMKFANGLDAGERRFIRNIKIIAVN